MATNPVSTLAEDCGIKVHIGSLISDELRRQRRPAAWLAQEICCDRTNVTKSYGKALSTLSCFAGFPSRFPTTFSRNSNPPADLSNRGDATDRPHSVSHTPGSRHTPAAKLTVTGAGRSHISLH